MVWVVFCSLKCVLDSSVFCWFNILMLSYQYNHSHREDETSLPLSSFRNGFLILVRRHFIFDQGSLGSSIVAAVPCAISYISVCDHHNDVILGPMASQITSLTIVYPNAYSVEHQRKHQSSASLAFVRGIHRRPVNSPHSPHIGPVTRKMFPFDDVIM